MSGDCAQNRAGTAEAGRPSGLIFVVTRVLIDRDSDSSSGTRADESSDNRAGPPAPWRRHIRAA